MVSGKILKPRSKGFNHDQLGPHSVNKLNFRSILNRLKGEYVTVDQRVGAMEGREATTPSRPA